MKCPFCGQKGARIDARSIKHQGLIHAGVICRNPHCSMYSPIVFGYHPDMLREKQKASSSACRSAAAGAPASSKSS